MNTRVSEGRTALAVTVLLIASLTIPTLLLGSPTSSAQQGQPSPSGTAAQVELLNPSGHSNVLSDKDSDPSGNSDPTDTQYHFNAWARNIPPSPLVEFFVIQGDSTILLGSTTGTGDTFDIFAAIPDSLTETTLNELGEPGANTATVRAVLYSNNGAQEVDRDEQTVIINQKDPSSDPLMIGGANRENAAETIEMVYPANRGSMGFFTQQGQQPEGTVDITTSAGTDDADVRYTLSPIGTEPTWKDCNSTDESRDDSADGVRCTLASGDRPDQVTAMAAVAMDDESSAPGGTNPSSVKNAGDAHRVVGFEQQPQSVFVTSHSVAAANMPGCSPVVTVRVVDGTGHEISNAQIDVHAQGPSDNLWFNTDDTETNPETSEPDANDHPENHPTESGRKCSDGAFSGTQGDHEVGGGFDRKHIESTDRTDDNGEFTYRMYGEVQGQTTMTAWVDKDDDDRFCATERSGSGVITWGSGGPAAPSPEGPEPPPCPSPSPTPSPSGSSPTSSASPTASPTPTPTPTATQTGSPTPTPTPTATQSGSPTPTPTQTGTATPSPTPTPGGTETASPPPSPGPGVGDREVTIEPSKPRKTYRRPFTLSGTVTSENPICTSGVTVNILRDVIGGNSEFEQVAVEQTGQDGVFSVNLEADRSANYVAQIDATATCSDALSTPAPVLVRVKVSMKVSDQKVRRGERVRLRLRTTPCPETARNKVLLFRAIEGKYGKTGKKRSNAQCRAAFTRRVWQHAVFQGRWPKQTPEFIVGRTRPKAVRVVR